MPMNLLQRDLDYEEETGDGERLFRALRPIRIECTVEVPAGIVGGARLSWESLAVVRPERSLRSVRAGNA